MPNDLTPPPTPQETAPVPDPGSLNSPIITPTTSEVGLPGSPVVERSSKPVAQTMVSHSKRMRLSRLSISLILVLLLASVLGGVFMIKRLSVAPTSPADNINSTSLRLEGPQPSSVQTAQGGTSQLAVNGDLAVNGILSLSPQAISSLAQSLSSKVDIQSAYPGQIQSGNINISGIIGARSFAGDGALLNSLNASQLTTGTVEDARLNPNITRLGQTIPLSALQTQVVASLGGVSSNGGDIALEAGTGITITPDQANNKIVIASTTSGGDITDVIAGAGLSGGGSSGSVTLSLNSSTVTMQGNNFNAANQLVQLDTFGALPAVSGANVTNLNAGSITNGTLSDSRLSSNVTIQGNTFNGNSQLVQLNGSGALPTLNGANLTNLSATQLTSGTVANARLSASVTLQGNAFNGANQLVQLNGSGTLPALNGSALTNLNATNLSTGTVADARLSTNVTLQGNTFNGANQLVQLTAGGALPTLDGSNLTNLTAGNITAGGTLPALNGSALTNLNATNLSTGTVANARLSNSVTLQGNTFNGASQLVQLTAGGILPVLSGANLTSLNATNLSTGTVADARLSANVTVQGNTFNGANQLVQVNGSGELPTISGVNLTNLNAGSIASGTVADARLSANVTVQGNTFNGVNQLLQVNGSGELPTISGVNLTNLNATSLATGTVADARLSANVTTQGNTFNLPSKLVLLDGSGYLPALNGSNLTSLNANSLSAGTVSDSRLSANVALLNAGQTFSGNVIFSQPLTVNTIQPSATMTIGATNQTLNLQGDLSTKLKAVSGGNTIAVGFTGTPSGNVNYNFDSATSPGTYTICTTVGNCAGSGSGVTTIGGTTNKLTKFTGSQSIGDSSITDTGLIVTVAATGLFKAGTDSTTAFRVQNAAGSSNVFTVDTTNTRVAIGQASASYPLDVAGDINSTTGLRVGGNLVCTSSGCSAGGGSGFYVQNGTSAQAGANFNIISTSASSVVGIFQGAVAQSADLLQAKNGAGTVVANITSAGNINTTGQYQISGTQISSTNLSNDANLAKLNGAQTFTGATIYQNAANSTSAFQIQNAAGTGNLFMADTTNGRIGVGTATPGYTVDVNGDVNISSGSAFRINGVAICGISTCAPSAGSSNYIQNGLTSQTANFNIQSLNSTSVVGILQGVSGQTADLLQARDSSNALLARISSSGAIYQGANQVCDTSNNCGYASSGGSNSYIQNGTTLQTANFNIQSAGGGSTGGIIRGAVSQTADLLQFQNSAGTTLAKIDAAGVVTAVGFSGSGTSLTGLTAGNITAGGTLTALNGSALTNLNATNLSTGTVADARLSANVTLQGNTFNGANQLVQLTAGGALPTLDGSNLTSLTAANITSGGTLPSLNGSALTSLNATNLSTGTVADARLSSNVTLQGNTFNGASQLVQLTAGGILPVLSGVNLTNLVAGNITAGGTLPSLNGSALTSLNATNLNTGTVADARLSANVALLNANNTFTGTFKAQNASNSVTAFQIQNAAGSSNLFNADTSNTRIGIGTAAPAYTLDVVGDINSSTALRVAGTTVCTASGCTASSGSGSYIQNGTSLQTANLNIQSAGVGSVAAGIRGATAQTADVLQVSSGSTSSPIVSVSQNNSNLISNPSFETPSVSGWASFAGATNAGSGADKYSGSWSMSSVNTATANAGANFGYALAASTTYSFSIFAKATVANFSTFQIGYTNDGTTNTSCLTAQTVTTTAWTRYTCTFTTSGSVSGSRYVYFLQTDAVARTFFVDAAQLEQAGTATPYSLGNIGLNGVINSPTVFQNTSDSLTAFAINSATGAQLFNVDSSTGAITVGGTSTQTGNVDIGTGTGAQTLNFGTGGTGIKTINVGTAAIANVITIGSTSATSLTLRAITANLDTSTGGTINIGASQTTGGSIVIGGTGAQTGAITIGNGTGAQTLNFGTGGTGVKTINVGTGASVANAIAIGGTGANVITIGNTQTAGSISLGAAMTTGTITIGGTGLQTGTIGIGTGTGAQTINLGTGGTGAKTINIGTGAVAQTITIGNTTGATGIVLNSGSAGVLSGHNSFFGTCASCTVYYGYNGGNQQYVNLGSNAGNSTSTLLGGTGGAFINSSGGIAIYSGTSYTVSIGTNVQSYSTLGNQIGNSTMALLSGTGGTSILSTGAIAINGATSSNITVGAALTTGIITIGGTAQTGNIDIGTGTGAQTLNFGTGGTGVKTINVGTAAIANVITIGSTSASSLTLRAGTTLTVDGTTTTAINVGASLTTGTITIGGTGAQTGTITIGSATGAQTIAIAGSNTGAKTVNIASGAVSNAINIGNTTGTTTTSFGVGATATNGISIITGATTGTQTLLNFTDGAAQSLGSISVDTTANTTTYNTTSDKRLKENITDTSYSLNDLLKISVTDYSFITDPTHRKQTGFLAQDLYSVFADAVKVGGDDPLTNAWGIDYGRLTPLLVKSIQDLNSKVDAQALSSSRLSQAVWSGGIVMQPTQFKNTVTFDTLADFRGAVSFKGDVEFAGRVTFADKDFAGSAKIVAGSKTATITFERPYEIAPIITLTPSDELIERYAVKNATTKGFDIVVPASLSQDVTFNWLAVPIKR